MVRFFGAVVIFALSAFGTSLVGAPSSWASGNCGPGYYENTDGQCIPAPTSTGSNSLYPRRVRRRCALMERGRLAST